MMKTEKPLSNDALHKQLTANKEWNTEEVN